jgi:hypothetical protein
MSNETRVPGGPCYECSGMGKDSKGRACWLCEGSGIEPESELVVDDPSDDGDVWWNE